jgi:nucleotide-binding universal stress UspA family protein
MQKILVPCDFSEQAINAVRFALDLADQTTREVHLLHVIELPIIHDSMLMVPVITKVSFGSTSLMILDYIDESGIDMVVMGTKGVNGLRELLIGSNAEKIVRTSPCPVITVRKECQLHAMKNIVFPNSLEDHQEELVKRIKVLHKVTYPRLEDFANGFGLKDYTINVYNDITEESGVISFAHKVKADMIVMGTHGRRGLNHIMSGSVAEDVVNHIDCPIWTYTIKN